MKVSLETRRAH